MASNSIINLSDAEDDDCLLNGSKKVEEEEEDLPSRDECLALTEKFAEITGTDTALAQFFLQDRSWDLQRSIDAYYASQKGGVNVLTDGAETEVVVTFDKKLASDLESSQVTTLAPKQFRVLSWNIDGLDSVNLKKRTKAFMKIIEREKADIVFLQEVIVTVFNYMEEKMPMYQFIAAGSHDYFCVIMLRRTTVYFDGHKLIEFDNTRMGRNLLVVDAHIGDCKLRLMTSHLESTRDGAKERVEQLQILLKEITTTPSELNCIFGGDTNLRDHEVVSVGGLPDDVSDIWEATGKRPEAKYTWDLTRNTNKSLPGNKARCRFDRMYLRKAPSSSSANKKAEAKYFGLVGIQKIELTQSYPSDHWGCLAHFDVVDCT